MNDQYQKGKEIGEITADIKNMSDLLTEHIKAQHEWNLNIEKEVNLLKAWVQTTTGKMVVLTTIFGIVGSVVYIIINWTISHWK